MSYYNSMRSYSVSHNKHIKFYNETKEIEIVFYPIHGWSDIESKLKADGLVLVCERCGFILE